MRGRARSAGFSIRGYHGQGYATEAANAMLDLAFGPGDIHRVAARCDVRNEASWRLMERLGMRREAHFREHAIFKSAGTKSLSTPCCGRNGGPCAGRQKLRLTCSLPVFAGVGFF